MGFLDNLLKREARRVLRSVADEVANNVADSARSAIRSTAENANQPASVTRSAARGREDTSGDNASCHGRSKVVMARIDKVLAEQHPGCTARRNVPIQSFGLTLPDSCVKREIDYILSDETGREVAAVLILKSGMDRRVWLSDLYRILEQHGLKHVHFLLQLPNRISYIEQKLAELFG